MPTHPRTANCPVPNTSCAEPESLLKQEMKATHVERQLWQAPARTPIYLRTLARALPAALRPPFCPVKLLPACLQAEVSVTSRRASLTLQTSCLAPRHLQFCPCSGGRSRPFSVPASCPGPGTCLARGRPSLQGERATVVQAWQCHRGTPGKLRDLSAPSSSSDLWVLSCSSSPGFQAPPSSHQTKSASLHS